MRYAVIMAGGSGTRFWPASRRLQPKQLLNLWGEPMICSTARRLEATVEMKNQWIVTGHHLVEEIAALLPEIPREQLLAEPQARNTAPCVGLAAALLQKSFGDSVIGVFPADHFIADAEGWNACLEAAYSAAEEGAIVTLGIRPTRPETGYGYIQMAEGKQERGSLEARKVTAFVEKPNLEKAKEYLISGKYLWNAGIFFFKTSTMLAEIARQLPELHKHLNTLRDAWQTPSWEETFAEAFGMCPSISIDHGVMEGAEDVRVIPADFGWSDVGHWGAMDEIETPDAQGNVHLGGAVLSIDTHNTVVVQTAPNSERLIATLGVKNLVIVDTPDALLVCDREQVQRVREVITLLKEQGRDDLT